MTCKQIREAIIEGENEQAVQIAKSLVNAGVNSEEIIIDGVTKAMEYLDEKC
ncbi:MAG: B12-binding domain-containing protein, partial [Deltaproteobacteria bacterium]|nr:B12-binding domain-containing protein [Deltaproteobacteria bacterium]